MLPHNPLTSLRKDINSILSDSLFIPAHASIKVVSLNNGEVLYERDSKALMNPASNMKLLTSAAALAILDTGYQFRTSIFVDKTPSNGMITGNVYIKGYGDPALRTSDLDSLASNIRQSGVDHITGDIIADDSYFDDEYWGLGWVWDDEPDPDDAPYINALCANGNCISVTIRPDPFDSCTISVSLDPLTDYISIINRVSLVDDSIRFPLKIRRTTLDKLNTIILEGELLKSNTPKTQRISLCYPHLYTARLFKESLQRAGILVDGKVIDGAIPNGSVELTFYQHTLEQVVTNLNKVSNNLSAENMLKVLGILRYGTPGTAKGGIYTIKSYIASIGIDTTKFVIVDGSGISRYNLLSAEQLVKLLTAVNRQSRIFPMFYNSLPMAGIDGTLAERMNNTLAAANLRAKTGTLKGVSCLSGYVRTRDGELLAFSMMMQNYITSDTDYRQIQDKIGVLLANFSRKVIVHKSRSL